MSLFISGKNQDVLILPFLFRSIIKRKKGVNRNPAQKRMTSSGLRYLYSRARFLGGIYHVFQKDITLMETLGSLIETYEAQNFPEIDVDPIDTLKVLMEEHGIRQSDLPEIGSQGVVSEIISGKRQLNIRQIKALGKRFNVSPAVFV